MKKLFLFATIALALFGLQTSAQTKSSGTEYKTSLGLGIDFGDGATFVGPSIKHFFAPNSAIEGDVLFGDSYTAITALYAYHQQFPEAAGLKWYVGAGPSVGLYKGGSDFFIRPVAGLDFKVKAAPIAFNFDWRPAIYLGEAESNFEAARFGIGFRYSF